MNELLAASSCVVGAALLQCCSICTLWWLECCSSDDDVMTMMMMITISLFLVRCSVALLFHCFVVSLFHLFAMSLFYCFTFTTSPCSSLHDMHSHMFSCHKVVGPPVWRGYCTSNGPATSAATFSIGDIQRSCYHTFANTTTDRNPFTDLYDTVTGHQTYHLLLTAHFLLLATY